MNRLLPTIVFAAVCLSRHAAPAASAGELPRPKILIIFTDDLGFSDNEACPYDRRSVGIDREPFEPDVTWSDRTGWAWARNTPFRYYKQNQFEPAPRRSSGIPSGRSLHVPKPAAPGAVLARRRPSRRADRPTPRMPAPHCPALASGRS